MEMTGEREDEVHAEAAAWHVRIDQPDMDWDGFASWLDSAPEHQAVYDRLAMLDDDIRLVRDEVRASLPANDPASTEANNAPVFMESPKTAWRWWTAGSLAVAAGVAGAVLMPTLTSSPVTMTTYATGSNETRTVSLTDGSSIRLDRNTRLAVADTRERTVRLDTGAAFFDVRHDADRPFAIISGDFKVRDLGTRFSVSRGAAQISVAVAQGLVEVQYRDTAGKTLKAGQQLDASGRSEVVTVRPVDAASVASWRDGRLVYDNSPLALIAQDMSRYTRRPVSIDPRISDLTFSGVLIIGDGSHLVDQLQALLPVEARDIDGGIRLVGVGQRS